jgi:pentapeptide MXKDX repeat protein
MNRITAGTVMAAMLLIGTQAFADDMAKDHMTQDQMQMMKDCMSRMSAKNDGSTKDQMRAACKTEMKNHMNKDGMNKDSMGNDTSMPHEGTPKSQ